MLKTCLSVKAIAFFFGIAVNLLSYAMFLLCVGRLDAQYPDGTVPMLLGGLIVGVLVMAVVSASWIAWKHNRALSLGLWTGILGQIAGYIAYCQWFEAHYM